MKKNLLIAGYTGYSTVDKVEDFVESFGHVRREHDEMCVIYDNRTEINEYLDGFDWVIQLKKERTASCNYVNRFLWFSEVIDTADHEAFITADIRDVIFQSNPFVWMEENLEKDYIFSDEGVAHVGTEGGKWNMAQAEAGFPDLAPSLKKKNVHNVGVMGGNKKLGKICYRVWDMCSGRHAPLTRKLEEFIIDQAAFNVLTHLTEEKAFGHPSTAKEDWVLTLATSPEAVKEIYLIENTLCNPDQKPYAIVHQADRHKNFMRYLGKGKFELFKGGDTYATATIKGDNYKG